MKKESQRDGIRKDFLAGKSITPLDALRDHGCLRLGSVIHFLRHEEELPIITLSPDEAYEQGYIDKTARMYIGAHTNIAVYCIEPKKLLAWKETNMHKQLSLAI